MQFEEGKCPPKSKHSPILTLFFLWRLHGKPRHGYLLVDDVKDISIAHCKPSTVYALLAKLEKSGLVKSRYDETSKHVRRIYQTTNKGWKLLQEIKKRKIKGLWREFVQHLLS
jgi:DNA-binding PadR family transcriptional regulator